MKIFATALLSYSTLALGQSTNGLRGSGKIFGETCTATIAEIEYSAGGSTKEFLDFTYDGVTSDSGSGVIASDTALYCETPSGHFYKLPVSAKWIKEKYASGEIESGVSSLDIPSGTQVKNAVLDIRRPPGLSGGRGPGRRLAQIGTKTVLVVRVQAADGTTGFDEAALSNSVFGANANLKTHYAACSSNKLIFNKAPDATGASSSISNGVVTVSIDTTLSEGSGVMRNAITAKLNSEFSVTSPSQLADHVMYCLPTGVAGMGIAYAYVNSWNSVYNNEWCTYVSAQMHEVGHNLGLGHSGELETYDDQTGMMGFSYGYDSIPTMCFNAAKSYQLGWFSDKVFTCTPSAANPTCNVQVGGAVDYGLSSVSTVVVKINQESLSDDFYLTYNAKKGANDMTQEGGNQVMIVSQGGEGVANSVSTLLSILSPGNTYEIVDFNGMLGDTVTVTVNSVLNSIADITITLAVPVPPEPTPGPTPNPTAPPTPLPTPNPTAPAPTPLPTLPPTPNPTAPPTPLPTPNPTAPAPTPLPTLPPTPNPTAPPTPNPTPNPTAPPPTPFPTLNPTPQPTESCICSSFGSKNDCRSGCGGGCSWSNRFKTCQAV